MIQKLRLLTSQIQNKINHPKNHYFHLTTTLGETLACLEATALAQIYHSSEYRELSEEIGENQSFTLEKAWPHYNTKSVHSKCKYALQKVKLTAIIQLREHEQIHRPPWAI